MRITIALLACLLAAPAAALAQGPQLQLDHLNRLSALASESANVTVDPAMLKLAAAFLTDDRKNPTVTEMLNELKGIYIKSFKFDRDNVYSPDDVAAVRKQLEAPGWSQMVNVESKGEQETNGRTTRRASLVQVYSWRDGNIPGGMAILVAEPRELTVVNIVGPLDLTRLGALQGQFGIPPLPNVPGVNPPTPGQPPPNR